MITSLGMTIDSRPLLQGASALDKLGTSAGSAQKAVTALEKATTDAGKSASVLDKATTDIGKSTSALGGKIKPANDALATITRTGAATRNELINLGRQAQDIGVSLLGGQSVLTVLAQQGSQVFDVFSSSKTATVGGVLKQVGSGIASVLTPTRLLVGGLGAVALGGIAVADALGKSALAAANLAKVTGTNIGSVRGLQTAASFKGIDADEAAKAMAQFASNVYAAKNNMGGLTDVFRANNIQAKDFNGYLDGASNLIRAAKGDTQLQFSLLQSMGLPATEKWVRLLEQGGTALRAAINANQGNPDAEDKITKAAQRFDDAWNSATTKASNYIKSWALSAWNAVDSVAAKVADGAGNFARAMAGQPQQERAPYRVNIDTSDFGKSDKKPVDPAAAQRNLALEQQRLGLLGQVATVNETVLAQEKAIQSARLSGVNISAADEKRILDNVKANALGTAQIRAQADALNVETATLGMTTGQAAAYSAIQARINEEKRKGNELSAPQLASLRAEADALGAAAQRAENLRTGYDALTNSGQTFLSSLRSGANVWDSFKSAGASALDTISQKLMKMATDNLWSSAFGGSSGGGLLSGLFGGLFGGGSGVNANGSIAGAVGPTSVGGAPLVGNYATGGYTGSGGKYEPAGIVHKGEYVMDAATTARIGVPNLNRLRGYANGGLVNDVSPVAAARIAAPPAGSMAPQEMNVRVEVSVANDGTLQAYVKDISQQTASANLTGYVSSKGFINDVGVASRKAVGQRK